MGPSLGGSPDQEVHRPGGHQTEGSPDRGRGVHQIQEGVPRPGGSPERESPDLGETRLGGQHIYEGGGP